MQRQILNLSPPPRHRAPKKSHEELDADLERFKAEGGVVTELPSYQQSVKPRASYSFGHGAGPQ